MIDTSYLAPVAARNWKGERTRRKFSCFVGNLPFDITECAVRTAFESCGPIAEVSLHKNESGRGTGCCIIYFEGDEGQRRALERHGEMVEGRTIRVERNMDASKRDWQPIISASNSCFVGDIPFTATDNEIHTAFGIFGKIRSIKRLPSEKGTPTGNAIVTFDSRGALEKAVGYKGEVIVKGRTVRVDYSKSKHSREIQHEYNLLSGNTNVLFSGVGPQVSPDDFKEFIAGKCGKLTKCAPLSTRDSDQRRQFFCVFAAPASVSAALQLMGCRWKGSDMHPLVVNDAEMHSAVLTAKRASSASKTPAAGGERAAKSVGKGRQSKQHVGVKKVGKHQDKGKQMPQATKPQGKGQQKQIKPIAEGATGEVKKGTKRNREAAAPEPAAGKAVDSAAGPAEGGDREKRTKGDKGQGAGKMPAKQAGEEPSEPKKKRIKSA